MYTLSVAGAILSTTSYTQKRVSSSSANDLHYVFYQISNLPYRLYYSLYVLTLK